MKEHEAALIAAVRYAMRCGCFFPVPQPKPGASTDDLIQWGAMRNLHDRVAEYERHSTPGHEGGRG